MVLPSCGSCTISRVELGSLPLVSKGEPVVAVSPSNKREIAEFWSESKIAVSPYSETPMFLNEVDFQAAPYALNVSQDGIVLKVVKL